MGRVAGEPAAASSGRAGAAVGLSTDLEDRETAAYFTWDDPMTEQEVRQRLATSSEPERIRLLARILREARDTDVWRFTTPQEVACAWERLARHLGRRRAFWDFLLRRWQDQGLISLDAAE